MSKLTITFNNVKKLTDEEQNKVYEMHPDFEGPYTEGKSVIKIEEETETVWFQIVRNNQIYVIESNPYNGDTMYSAAMNENDTIEFIK